jgi:hypothetical protein
LPAIAILVLIGLLNVLTVAFVAEAVVRTGPMRRAATPPRKSAEP